MSGGISISGLRLFACRPPRDKIKTWQPCSRHEGGTANCAEAVQSTLWGRHRGNRLRRAARFDRASPHVHHMHLPALVSAEIGLDDSGCTEVYLVWTRDRGPMSVSKPCPWSLGYISIPQYVYTTSHRTLSFWFNNYPWPAGWGKSEHVAPTGSRARERIETHASQDTCLPGLG